MENQNDTMELPEATAPAEKQTAFCIDSEGAANWLLSKLAANEAEAQRIKAQAAARAAELKSDSERLLHLFGGQLEAWAQSEAEKRRRKTITLLQGSLSFRTAPARFTLADNEAAFVHARTAFPDCVQTIQSLDRAAYIKMAEATGEVLPGLEAQPARETFGIKFATAKSEQAEPDAPETEPDERHGLLKRLFPK